MDDLDSIEVSAYLSTEAMLEQTAEEATELAQACLKMARKSRGENPTPKTYSECIENLNEEIADVMLCLNILIDQYIVLSHESIESVIIEKEKRFKERLLEKGE